MINEDLKTIVQRLTPPWVHGSGGFHLVTHKAPKLNHQSIDGIYGQLRVMVSTKYYGFPGSQFH